MIPLKRLLFLQASFALMAMSFLALSGWRMATQGEPLSAAPVAASLVMFTVYSGCLLLPKWGLIKTYRAAMVLAVLAFGGGGVAGNIWNFLENGLADYASLSVFIIAVSINSYGTLLNIAALTGWFTLPSLSAASTTDNQ